MEKQLEKSEERQIADEMTKAAETVLKNHIDYKLSKFDQSYSSSKGSITNVINFQKIRAEVKKEDK